MNFLEDYAYIDYDLEAGTKYILVIRVSGFSNGELQEVSQSKAQLSNDIFHYGNNNLVSAPLFSLYRYESELA